MDRGHSLQLYFGLSRNTSPIVCVDIKIPQRKGLFLAGQHFGGQTTRGCCSTGANRDKNLTGIQNRSENVLEVRTKRKNEADKIL